MCEIRRSDFPIQVHDDGDGENGKRGRYWEIEYVNALRVERTEMTDMGSPPISLS